MKVGKVVFGTTVALISMVAIVSVGFSQGRSAQTRIAQQIVVNGQPANGAYVQNAGGMQSFTCTNPQSYSTANGASSGWACYDQSTATYLLNALPPVQAQAPAQAQAQSQNEPWSETIPVPLPQPQQPPIVYGAPLPAYTPAPVVPAYGYYPYDYYAAFHPYGYYPYGYYPYFVGARLGVGFGYGYRGPVIGARPFGGVSVVRAGGRIGGGHR